MLNNLICIGTLIRDVELYEGKNHDNIAKLFVEIDNEPAKDYFEAVIIGDNGKIAKEQLHKGDTIVIEGAIHNRYWHSKNGENRVKTEIKIRRFTLIGKGKNSE